MNSLYSPSVLAHLHGSAGYEGGAAHTPLGCSRGERGSDILHLFIVGCKFFAACF